MESRSQNRRFASVSILALMVATSTAATAQEARTGLASGEIIVTATRRAESIQKVPISITALDEAALTQQGIRDFSSVATAVPSVALQEGGPGFRNIYIRGIATGVVGTTPTTGFYYDETFVEPGGLTQSIVEPLFFDIERVEVLRGPQGTLFGGSAMGGAVRFISKKPDPGKVEAAVGADLSYTKSGDVNYETAGMVNVPLIQDRLAVRLVAVYRDDSGYIDRLTGNFAGPQRAATGPTTRIKNINDSDFLGLRGMIEARLTEDFTARATVAYQKNRSEALPVFDSNPGTLEQRRTTDIDDSLDDEFILGNLTLEYALGKVNLLSSTSYTDRDFFYFEDGDGVQQWQLQGLPATLNGRPARAGGPREDKAFTQELRVVSDLGGAFEFTLGAYYEDWQRSRRTFGQVERLGVAAPGSFADGTFDQAFLIGQDQQREQWAVFGEASYSFTEQLKLTAGTRYYDMKIEELSVGRVVPNRTKENGFSPRVSLSYDVNDQALFYASAARGFRPGTTNNPRLAAVAPANLATCQAAARNVSLTLDDDGRTFSSAQSDSLWTYEAGAKAKLADGRVTFNVAGYYSDWKDIQLLVFLPAPCSGFVRANAGDATVKGLEFEFNAEPAPGISFFGGVGYTDAQLTRTVPGTGVVDGGRLTSVPKWTASLNARATLADPIGQFEPSLTVSYRYTGPSVAQIVPSANPPRQEEINLVNLRAALTSADLTLELYVNNLFDVQPERTFFVTTFDPQPFPSTKFFTERPRTIGIAVRSRF